MCRECTKLRAEELLIYYYYKRVVLAHTRTRTTLHTILHIKCFIIREPKNVKYCQSCPGQRWRHRLLGYLGCIASKSVHEDMSELKAIFHYHLSHIYLPYTYYISIYSIPSTHAHIGICMIGLKYFKLCTSWHHFRISRSANQKLLTYICSKLLQFTLLILLFQRKYCHFCYES